MLLPDARTKENAGVPPLPRGPAGQTRIEAANWLADWGFGKAPLLVTAGVTAEHILQDYFRKLLIEDLEAMRAILEKYAQVQ